MVAEGHQREHRLVRVRAARELDRALEVLARLDGVADAAEDAAEDAVSAARGANLAEALGEPQRLLRGVDREHVVARLHVQPGGLLIQAHERERRLAVLDQVDASLVVLDRLLALALVRQPGADLAVQLGDVLEVLAAAVMIERPLPDVDRGVDAAEPQRDIALLLEQAGERLGILAGLLERGLVVGERIRVGVEGGCRVAGGLQVGERLCAVGRELVGRAARARRRARPLCRSARRAARRPPRRARRRAPR